MKLNPFSTDAIALQQRPPSGTARMVSASICLMAVITLVYASLASMDIVVTAQGKVIPSGKSKVIQPLEAGVVRHIAVKDGQKVKAGEVLVELDATNTGADRDRLQREFWEAQADVARVSATLTGKANVVLDSEVPQEIADNQRAMLTSRLSEHRSRLASLQADLARRQADRDGVSATLAQLRTSLPLVKKKVEMREDLARSGHITEAGLIETRLEFINVQKDMAIQENRLKEADAALHAVRQQMAQADAEFRARSQTELMEVTKKREAASQELIKASQRRDLQVLRSPIDGVVQQLSVSTVGGVVTQAQPLMTIVPENATLEVEAQVLNRDIGHVKVGQRVINKVETFDFTRYGYIEGTVLWVGTDAVSDPKMGLVYPVRLALNEAQTPQIVNGRKGVVTAGMSVTSDLRTGERRLIHYFLAPLLRYREESLRER
jgi:hemolysin D